MRERNLGSAGVGAVGEMTAASIASTSSASALSTLSKLTPSMLLAGEPESLLSVDERVMTRSFFVLFFDAVLSRKDETFVERRGLGLSRPAGRLIKECTSDLPCVGVCGVRIEP